jgi:hypothetical protein
MPPIYLDYNASTPIDPALAAALRPFLNEATGRGQVAALLGAAPDEIVFITAAAKRTTWPGHVLRAEPQRGAYDHLGNGGRTSSPRQWSIPRFLLPAN